MEMENGKSALKKTCLKIRTYNNHQNQYKFVLLSDKDFITTSNALFVLQWKVGQLMMDQDKTLYHQVMMKTLGFLLIYHTLKSSWVLTQDSKS